MKPTLQQLYEYQATLIDLPQFLVMFRKTNRITQKELAEELGLTDGAVSEDERGGGYNRASLNRLLQVINALIRLNERKILNKQLPNNKSHD